MEETVATGRSTRPPRCCHSTKKGQFNIKSPDLRSTAANVEEVATAIIHAKNRCQSAMAVLPPLS